jgi:hypothetical protein
MDGGMAGVGKRTSAPGPARKALSRGFILPPDGDALYRVATGSVMDILTRPDGEASS